MPCSDLVLLQRKVDIVSAFCMIFGFELSIPKLRSLLMEWGNEVSDHLFPKINIHTWGWVPTEVGVGWKIPKKDENGMEIEIAVQGLHSLKYLGIPIDSNNLYEKLFQETLQIIRNMRRVIASKKPLQTSRRAQYS